MKNLLSIFLVSLIFFSCHKVNMTNTGCDMQQIYLQNANKVTITNGIWGTLSAIEGNCMPTVPPSNSGSCKNCPMQRTIKIYQYTLLNDATPSGNSPVLFDSFNTPLVAQVDTDDNGFFQVNLPAGHYSIAIVEDGKLYANILDGQGGLNPFTLVSGTKNVNVTMTYKAVF